MTITQEQNDALTKRIEGRLDSVSAGVDFQRQRIAQLEHVLARVLSVAESHIDRDRLTESSPDDERIIAQARHLLGFN